MSATTTTTTTTTSGGGTTATTTIAAVPTAEGIPPAADSNPLAAADPAAHGMSAERLARVGALMQKMVDEGTIPYARCKVMRHGQLVYDSTVNSALGTQTEDSIYRFYSMTKIIASAVCMIGVERGLMRLDDPIEKYIPEFASTGVYKSGTVEGGDLETEPAATMATIRQCLTHTAGFGYGGLFGAFGLSDEVCNAYIKEGCGADMLNGSMAAKWCGILCNMQPLLPHRLTRCVQEIDGGARESHGQVPIASPARHTVRLWHGAHHCWPLL
jgi:hypothetical protein